MNAGKIVAIAGPVVDVEFRDCALPKIREALTVEVRGHTYVMEVAQQIGDGTVRFGFELRQSGNTTGSSSKNVEDYK